MGIRERKEREKDRRRQQIIVAAKRIFTAKGFQKTTMEDIAREAELSPGTIYLYFKNKEELYASLTLRILQYILMRVEHIEDDLDPEARLKSLMEAMFDVYAFDPLVVINMFHLQSSEILKNLSPELREEIETMSRKALSEIAAIFSSGIAEGVFVNRNPMALADIFWSTFSGVILWEESKRLIDNTKDFLRPTLETAFELFARGLMRRSQDNAS